MKKTKLAVLGTAALLLPCLSTATPAGAASPTQASAQYVAMGDSYASGEGAYDYIASTNTKTNQCHRALDGYAEGLSSALGLSLGFVACSGAVISDLYEPNTEVAGDYFPASQVNPPGGDVGEGPQMDALGPQTQLVTVSIGGNDAGFTAVLTDCINGVDTSGSYGCAGRDNSAVQASLGYLAGGRPAQCLQFLPYANPPVNSWEFCNAEASLETVYENIAAAAPNAAIYIVGYPHLFGTKFTLGLCEVGSVGPVPYTIKASDARWLDSEADQVDGVISSAVAGAAAQNHRAIYFVDPRPAFAGHGLCDTSTPWFNPLTLELLRLAPASESFHPNYAGQQALESLLYSTITSNGSQRAG